MITPKDIRTGNILVALGLAVGAWAIFLATLWCLLNYLMG